MPSREQINTRLRKKEGLHVLAFNDAPPKDDLPVNALGRRNAFFAVHNELRTAALSVFPPEDHHPDVWL